MTVYSIIQKSQLEGAHRLDAEYYQPEYLQYINQLHKFQTKSLDSLAIKIDVGFVSSMTNHFQNTGIPLLRTQNVSEFVLNLEKDVIYIDEDFHKRLKKSQIFPGYVLLARSGSIGNAAVVPEHFPVANSADIILIQTKQGILPEFLAAFLNSRYGRFQIDRAESGGLQGHINLYNLQNLQLPVLPVDLQEKIKQTILEGFELSEQSERLYKEAENLLLQELGLADFRISDDLSFEVNFSEVQEAGRMDADYFQPKYDKLLSQISNTKSLDKYIENYSTGFPFKSDNYQSEGIPLIRINNIRKGYIDLSDTAYLLEKDYSLSLKDIAKPGDIVLSMSGTIGMSAVISKDIPICSVNQRILRFHPKNIDADYLVLVLNSIIGSYQLQRIGTGGVQTNISYKDIKNILIPELSLYVQQKIADLMKKSHEARKKSKELLEEAKRKVEEMIEKGI